MPVSFEVILFIVSVLIISSIVIMRFSDNLGVPSLVLFLIIGMIAGSDGIGKIHFEDYQLTQSIGIIALIFILFTGGLDTKWNNVKSASFSALSLSTLGVLLVTTMVGLFCHFVLRFDIYTSMLFGAIISSTDAAAVFSVLRAKSAKVKDNVKNTLELESGSNDPFAIFLTISIIGLIAVKDYSLTSFIFSMFFQFAVGFTVGAVSGRFAVFFINRFRFAFDSLVVVFFIAYSILIYSAVNMLNGSGMLAVYVSALFIGNSKFIQQKSLNRFFEGLSLLSQIIMFLAFGLLSYPSEIIPLIITGLILSVFLMLGARPLSVFISLMFAKMTIREKAFISWAGLRGAVPIILATYPVVAGVENSLLIFHLVFFVTITSALLQGWTINGTAKLLGVSKPDTPGMKIPIEIAAGVNMNNELIDIIIPYNADITGKTLAEAGLPGESLITVVFRNNQYIVPSGSTMLEEGDVVLVLTNKINLPEVKRILTSLKKA